MNIWELVCHSPSGSVMLLSNPSNRAGCVLLVDDTRDCHHPGGIISDEDSECTKCWNMNFAVFGTCKQIYHETKDLLWKQNTLVTYLGQVLKYRSSSILKRVVRLELDIELRDYTATADLWSTVPVLENLSKTGKLDTLTLRTRGVPNLQDHRAHFGDLGEVGRWCDALSNASLRLSLLRRKIIIDTDWYSLNPQNEDQAMNPDMSGHRDVVPTIKKLHCAFGGQLWQDGILSWEDGRQIVRPSKPGAEEMRE
jgi:hypothetical protein